MLKSIILRLALAGSMAGAVLSPAMAAPTGLSKPEMTSSTASVDSVAYRYHRGYYGGYGRGPHRGGYYGHRGYRGRGYRRY